MLHRVARRAYSAAAAARSDSTREGWLYVDSVFPVQLGRWDVRHYIGILREERLLNDLQSHLEKLSSVCDFKPLELEPLRKDGGVFVRFSYTNIPEAVSDGADPFSALQKALNEEAQKYGALPTWLGVGTGSLWVVKGLPWKEDMNRFASPILKVAFDGPDIQEQSLYELCRPFGRIRDLIPPTPVPAGSLRSSTITFERVHAATIARNVIHGLQFPSSSDLAASKTRLRAKYEEPLQAHVFRDWMSSHPKIMLPIVVFLLGTLTYTIFDPIRSLMVEAKMLNWFDYRKFRLYQWLQTNTVDRSTNNGSDFKSHTSESSMPEVWKERRAAQSALHAYLADTPTTIAFVHGPQGSGKTTMVETVVRDSKRAALVINCRNLHNTSTDSALVSGLAGQTGYWPVFNFLNSMNTLIDLASVGLIGQKAGVSSSLHDQLKRILDVVTYALRGVSSSHRGTLQKQLKNEEDLAKRRLQAARQQQAILDGTWHDGRLDCVAGNGIMCELGVGDELFDEDMAVHLENYENNLKLMEQEQQHLVRKQKALTDVNVITSLPVVVIHNYATNFGSTTKEDLLVVLAEWTAKLVENNVAHVIVLSDNRENAKRMTKALSSKPLNAIALSDADTSSSLSFVKQKLEDSGASFVISVEDVKHIERLGGRASDLESLIHKVRNGMRVDEAVEDIINRGVAELRKNAFGDDNEDAKGLPWTRYQVWKVLKMLAKSSEVGYYDMLVDFPFKGDESALRNMEHAELISISTKDGRPTTIRPGKPVFRWVFERVVNDKVFQATQELAYNENQVLELEAKIQRYEQELAVLVDTMMKEHNPWYSFRRSACVGRARSVGEKIVISQHKVAILESKNIELKRVLAKEVK
ncbi:hypothetical protein BDN70DRAFT_883451 [Pholiota conissans]|uniref:Mitochondrial escape protein 2 n=1 Tax=Pholiota conissans TaxID=109636 RepID=A0A9P5YTW1_9AGAR|nr:hypothetical protein BDN70DRAFT_883451 [Pholiota conissans]